MGPPLWTIFLGYFDACDLSKDDDVLGHMLVDLLGTGSPLGMRYMRLRARFPPHEYSEVLDIVRAEAFRSFSSSKFNTRRGVDSLLVLPSVSEYLKTKTEAQINAFATHALRYLILYNHDCPVEIAQTYRYASRTGKGELCVLASQSILAGHPIHHLQGTLAPLSLKQENMLESDHATGRDFSIIRINGRSFLLLGPLRFVNHDCAPNSTLERVGKIIRVKALRHIVVGEEITISYSPAYFGDDNRDCLCLSCERAGIRGFAVVDSPASRPISADPNEATNVRVEEILPGVVHTSSSSFSSMTCGISPTPPHTRGLRRRSPRLNHRQAVSHSHPVPSRLISKVEHTSASDEAEYYKPTGLCVTCCVWSVSTPDALLCARCLRHFAIFGVAWPRRVPEDRTRQFSPIPPPKCTSQFHIHIPTGTSSPVTPVCPQRNLKRKRSKLAQVSFDDPDGTPSGGSLSRMCPRKRRKCSV